MRGGLEETFSAKYQFSYFSLVFRPAWKTRGNNFSAWCLCAFAPLREMKETSPKPVTQPRIVAVSVSDRNGVVKHNVPEARLLLDHGLAGDAHAEGGIRQVSLLARESIDKMRAAGAQVNPGDFAENLTTAGLDVCALPVGTRLKVGAEVELEITQIGKACHQGCAIREQVGDCVMPREGVFARVLQEGLVKPGDVIEVLAG